MMHFGLLFAATLSFGMNASAGETLTNDLVYLRNLRGQAPRPPCKTGSCALWRGMRCSVRPGENVIAIRVEDKNGQGGLTKRCFLKYVKK